MLSRSKVDLNNFICAINQYAITHSGLNSIFLHVQKCTALQCSCYVHDLKFVKILINDWKIMAEQTIAARMWSSCGFQDLILWVATARNDPICDIPINIKFERDTGLHLYRVLKHP